MHSANLYLVTVLIWGSSWYAIKFQLGVVEAEISLVYRFLLASVILLLFCLVSKRSLRFSPSQHLFIFLQGLFLFSTNYLIFYWATGLLTSGIVALLFSTVILMNIVNGVIFMRQTVKPQVVIGAMFGITGIAAIFWSEVAGMENDVASWKGLLLCLLATFSASLGNILSARNQKNNLPVVQTNAWGMAYGALIMAAYAFYQGSSFSYDLSISYSVSLLYLSLFGSVFAFGSYLTLIGRIGADKTSYTAVLFPVIALSISTVFEGYHWTLAAMFGFSLVLIGNYLVLKKPAKVSDS
ncbi:MAG: DMT family transporter [Gammaproteobacteria bacterium]|nr:DMT family transporter [Gammaproteobacteria bacterium]